MFSFFFFNDTATTEIYTLSLHDALPIWILDSNRLGSVSSMGIAELEFAARDRVFVNRVSDCAYPRLGIRHHAARSEEHTSELQSQSKLVCRLLLEKKKI